MLIVFACLQIQWAILFCIFITALWNKTVLTTTIGAQLKISQFGRWIVFSKNKTIHNILAQHNEERGKALFVWLIMCPPSVQHMNGKEKWLSHTSVTHPFWPSFTAHTLGLILHMRNIQTHSLGEFLKEHFRTFSGIIKFRGLIWEKACRKTILFFF